MLLCSSVPEQNETLLVINLLVSKIIALLHFFTHFLIIFIPVVYIKCREYK